MQLKWIRFCFKRHFATVTIYVSILIFIISRTNFSIFTHFSFVKLIFSSRNDLQSRSAPLTSNSKQLYNHWDTADAARQLTEKQFTQRSWQLRFGTLNMTNCTTKYNVKVQTERVPPNVVQNVNSFYVCEGCGKVYWYGSHMERVLKGNLKDILV